MTASRQSLPRFADELIRFHEQGYQVIAKPAQGEDWQEGDGKLYEAQLARVADYYLEHPEVTPTYLFREMSFLRLLTDEPREKYAKMCAAAVKIVAYDVDGRLYPCHPFLPNVHGKADILDDLKHIDFLDTSRFIDDQCMTCDILKLCRTCCARNYNERGDIRFRDRRACQMILAEAKVVSSYQIKKMMRYKDRLTPEELLALKAAIRCYRLCCTFEDKLYVGSK
jgi:radical SAM protein with 4Fe4S-binding SPASM domain